MFKKIAAYVVCVLFSISTAHAVPSQNTVWTTVPDDSIALLSEQCQGNDSVVNARYVLYAIFGASAIGGSGASMVGSFGMVAAGRGTPMASEMFIVMVGGLLIALPVGLAGLNYTSKVVKVTEQKDILIDFVKEQQDGRDGLATERVRDLFETAAIELGQSAEVMYAQFADVVNKRALEETLCKNTEPLFPELK